MRKVFTIGETVLDLIFKRNKILFAKPGGAMLNSAVSLGRLSIPVSFITEIGEDNAGSYILEFLHQNDVDTSYCYRFKKGQTALALAFLDEHENADYSFYKNYPNERMNQEMPLVSSNDIVLFGSFFAITREVRIPLMNFIKHATQQNAIILYDPNFRKPHLHELPEIRDDILENISYSSIVRGSDEDFNLIFKTC
jgi:fructokinase